MHRVIALVIVALAAGCPTPLPPVDAGVEDDAGPQPTPFTCTVDVICDHGALGQQESFPGVIVCAQNATDADRLARPDDVCAQTCGTAVVFSCQDSCESGFPAPAADPCRDQ